MKKLILAVLVSLGLQTQAQQSWCDSLTYQTFPNTTLTVTGNSNGLSNIVGPIDWNWTACNSVACYIPQGNNPYSFPLINVTDTVKLCYDAFIFNALDSTMTICNHCDSLVYSWNQFTWVLFNSTTVGIEELIVDQLNDNKMYDLLGRELLEVPVGQLYIKNRKKYIKTI
jgi:hypothetical protein|tara:strand:- start:345 stop:854 length:510 start_codon:yes stop_codon:yes gene_type:complete